MAIPLWIRERVWMKELLRRELECDCRILFPEHHESHAASAFFPSPFSEAAFLTIDGVGEWTTTSYGIGRGNRIQMLAEIRFPHSLGLLYSAFTYFTGFKVNSGEYKLMGLAPYGEPKYVDLILRDLIDLKNDGSIRLNWRLIHLAMPTIDYVVAHELAHLRHMDHSPRFWDVVRSVVPDYEQRRGGLQDDVLPVFD